MEGTGSRLGRASSRYVPPPPPTKEFNGPVRKWKKKWVHVSPPNVTYKNSRSHSIGHSKPSRLFLCRWTPISSNTSCDAESLTEEQPRRKFRYTPAVVDEKANDEVKTLMKPGIAVVSMRNTQASNQGLVATQTLHRSHFELDLFFTANSDNHNSLDQIEDAQFGRGSSGGFGAMG